MIPINKPWLGEDEKQEILNILEENVLTSPAIDGGKKYKNLKIVCNHI